jgi:hypothetical protein
VVDNENSKELKLLRALWLVLIILLCQTCVHAANFKLYLKDGTYQITREYTVEGDRVRYYATERGEWEEIPLSLVDLDKTKAELKQHEDAVREETKAMAEEDQAERVAAREVRRVPIETGVYLVAGEKLEPLKQGESKIVNNKRRTLLAKLSPIPLVTGKATLELDGPHSTNVVSNTLPEFYIRLTEEERFGMVRFHPHNNNRVVENLTIIPVSKEVVEEPEMVEVFRKQVGEALYKIWPAKPLEPGEYGVVEYTDGKMNLQIWDFTLR